METRQAERFKASFKVKLRVDPAQSQSFSFRKDSVEVQALDVSVLGIGILSKYFIPKGVIVDLELLINDKTVSIKGEIRSSISGGKGLTRLGIKFTDISQEASKVLADFVKENERRSQPRLNLS